MCFFQAGSIFSNHASKSSFVSKLSAACCAAATKAALPKASIAGTSRSVRATNVCLVPTSCTMTTISNFG